MLGWRHDVIFTSGASESVEIAGARAVSQGRAYLATEHAIVPYAFGAEAAVIPVDADGLVDEAALDGVLAAGAALIAIQQVNNETGVVQPLERLAPNSRSRIVVARRLCSIRLEDRPSRCRFAICRP